VLNEPVDPETLAALLDGQLSCEERARVLARLAKSEREYEDLLETIALEGQLNADPAADAPTPAVALVRAP
jgi:anti-sigma factor RsiW